VVEAIPSVLDVVMSGIAGGLLVGMVVFSSSYTCR
jgi:hypothetical protein